MDEFLKVMHRGHDDPGQPPMELEEEAYIAMFQEMDKDGDGTVEYHEFAEMWALEQGHS